MSHWRRGSWWLAVAALVLLYLPLRAQETAPPATAATPAPAATGAPTPAPAREADSADQPVPAEKPPTDVPEERVSADNNLSFPVDI